MAVTRADLLGEYDRLLRQMVKVGLEPTVTDAVLDCFTEPELRLLIKDAVLRLVQVRRLEG
jgi:hypothetical protein